MGHGKLRSEKNCLNCGKIVEEKFCPNCGQENIEPKQAFHFLFTHFVEDFTHYDGQFWKTIKYLLFRPGKLTNEYLAGKRQQYVIPVKLYIFVSFITFFLFSLSSPIKSISASGDNKTKRDTKKEIIDAINAENTSRKTITKEDSLALLKVKNYVKDSAEANRIFEETDIDKKLSEGAAYKGFKTQNEYD